MKIIKKKTILLTSAGMQVKEEILKILPGPANQMKLAHIITASKPEKNKNYMYGDIDRLKEMGFQVENIDVEGKSKSEVRELLRDKNIIYVQGGNTFYLLKYIKESGADAVIKELVDKGVIYIGVSAGTCIACPTIDMRWKPADKNIVGLKDLSALNFVPFFIQVHYEPKHKEGIMKAEKSSKYPIRVLTDDQAFHVTDNGIKFVGKGEEIKI